MTYWKVLNSFLQGEIIIPPSKSQTIRALLFALLANGQSMIENALVSPDIAAMMRACSLFGGELETAEGKIIVQGVGTAIQAPPDVIDAGNSGLVLRFAGALGALTPGYTVVTGDASIRCQRPVQPLLDGLNGLGAMAVSTRHNGAAPIIVKGPIRPGRTSLSGADSQPVSSLLTVAACLDGITEIEVISPGETPWIALTLSWLRRTGAVVIHQDYSYYRVQGPLNHKGFAYRVPGDFSSALFPVVAALATRSSITVQGLDRDEVQGDKEVFSLLQRYGAPLRWGEDDRTLEVQGNLGQWSGGTIDINAFIDALPALAVLACTATGETLLYNGAIARVKECDRIAAMTTELKKMGADITEQADGLLIRPASLRGAIVDSYGDHRIAMAMAVAGLTATGETTVTGVECVSKSYPSFCRDMSTIGATIVEEKR